MVINLSVNWMNRLNRQWWGFNWRKSVVKLEKKGLSLGCGMIGNLMTTGFKNIQILFKWNPRIPDRTCSSKWICHCEYLLLQNSWILLKFQCTCYRLIGKWCWPLLNSLCTWYINFAETLHQTCTGGHFNSSIFVKFIIKLTVAICVMWNWW